MTATELAAALEAIATDDPRYHAPLTDAARRLREVEAATKRMRHHVSCSYGTACVDHCMTIPEAMALLRAAPKMGARWEHADGGSSRSATDGSCLALAHVDGRWSVWDRSERVAFGASGSVYEAMDCADKWLRAAGWLLEEG